MRFHLEDNILSFTTNEYIGFESEYIERIAQEFVQIGITIQYIENLNLAEHSCFEMLCGLLNCCCLSSNNTVVVNNEDIQPSIEGTVIEAYEICG